MNNKIRYNNANRFFREKFGDKIIKVALDGGFTCPNRDGTLSYGGCIFCSEKGSGDFAGDRSLDIENQFEISKKKMNEKWKNGKYIAYFQAFTNTYAPLDYLKEIFTKASNLPDVVGIFIATRPDCITEDIAKFLSKLNEKIYVCIELGFQTSKKESIQLINRCYENEVFENCVKMLNKYNIDIIVHTILGLPYEDKKDMLNTIKYVSKFNISGIKLQLLHIIKDTSLHKLYVKKPFKTLTLEEYIDIVVSCIEILPPNIVIHRITGDGDKATLVEPKWSLNKKVVLNGINKELNTRNTFQGRLFGLF
ncbi:TIGR01212 family radical SAM protein [uncultured Tyzzerella sp.]|uniref:TIGR01212 family radical SAM protein n=1 Tax=uncultured Tyzzerella sp. TaxID=2321398 RepID=UPI002942F197|nr:TIGR01212 family radical SAM protein [uncultured Tyzzerella sp.]